MTSDSEHQEHTLSSVSVPRSILDTRHSINTWYRGSHWCICLEHLDMSAMAKHSINLEHCNNILSTKFKYTDHVIREESKKKFYPNNIVMQAKCRRRGGTHQQHAPPSGSFLNSLPCQLLDSSQNVSQWQCRNRSVESVSWVSLNFFFKSQPWHPHHEKG